MVSYNRYTQMRYFTLLDINSIFIVKNDGFKLKQGLQLAVRKNDGSIVHVSDLEIEVFKLIVNSIVEDIADKMVKIT